MGYSTRGRYSMETRSGVKRKRRPSSMETIESGINDSMETSESGIKDSSIMSAISHLKSEDKEKTEGDIASFSTLPERKPPISALLKRKYEPPQYFEPKPPWKRKSIMSPMRYPKKIGFRKIQPVSLEDFSKKFGLDALCILAIDSFNRQYNTKYEFLKIEDADVRKSGSDRIFYITFQAGQNDTTQTFQTGVYNETKDITEVRYCRLEKDSQKMSFPMLAL
ncbi:hypothetical protein CCACVL1_15402 [Corchorus capsularis]|uniref:Uncharacterized protein n=1 Tax=Corchorus capsularis TaxID=210143 RepID=A0A1R3I2J6_COCAP|nr:hypothetical protein CCACVL1_15402 [Corchorus capsularis]